MIELRQYPPATMRQIGELLQRSWVTIHARMVWLEENGFIRQADNVPVGAARSKILTMKGFVFLDNPGLKLKTTDHANPVHD